MRIRSTLVGVAAGVVLGAGGIVAIDAGTESADAQSGDDFATQAEVQAANARAQAGINMGKRVWNLLGIYGAEQGELVGKNSGPIKQERGQGGGLPEQVLSAGVQAKLNGSGSVGPAGPPGPTGATGPAGPPGLANVETVTTATVEVLPGKAGSRIALCPTGKVALGGGVTPTLPGGTPVISGTAGANPIVIMSYPRPGAEDPLGREGWVGAVENPSGHAEPAYFVVYAVCAEVAT